MKHLVRSTLLLLARNPEKLYLIKAPSFGMNIFPLIHVSLPLVKEVFLYRGVRAAATSFKKILLANVPYIPVQELYPIPHEVLRDSWDATSPHSYDTCLVLNLISNLYTYLTHATLRTDITAYDYESLIRDPNQFCVSFFRDIGIGKEFVGAGLTAMRFDSQENSSVSRSRLSGTRGIKIEEQALEEASKVARKLGVRLEGEGYQVRGMPNMWKSS